jgi:RNase P/RNase MRP subunit POP5
LRGRKPKRYVLIQAEGKLAADELSTLTRTLQQRHGNLGFTLIDDKRTSLIVKTDRAVAEGIRESLAAATFGGTRVTTVLTSGSIGKLKRRARGSSASEDAKVLQR